MLAQLLMLLKAFGPQRLVALLVFFVGVCLSFVDRPLLGEELVTFAVIHLLSTHKKGDGGDDGPGGVKTI